MSSKYLGSLSADDYNELTAKLANIQNHICFICNEEINLDLHAINIDHIIPLVSKGKDSEENFALVHESCNKSKQDANLKIARILHKLKKIQDEVQEKENKAASLKQILKYFEGSKYDFKFKIEDGNVLYSFSELGDNQIYKSKIFIDKLSKEQTFFIDVPIEYIFHDELINPRSINSSISLLIKEFEKSNPQLHLTIARIDEGKIKIFDGQHKAVAQIMLGSRKFPLRIFIKPDIDRLIETNTNAGSTLRQIAFDKSIMRQLNNTLYYERVKKYQADHSLEIDNFSFSEQQLVDYFRGEYNLKKYIIDSIKHSITYAEENKLKDYIDFEGRAKNLPISYSAFDKTFLALFIDSKLILPTPINYRSEEGLNPRELEIKQIVKLLNIIAEEIYIGKFNPEIGVARIEQKILNKKDQDLTEDHLIAFRISKEETMYNWLLYLQNVIASYFSSIGKLFDQSKLFQLEFDEQLWINIRNFIINLKNLPLWKDKGMSSTIFSVKRNYDYWRDIFKTGKSSDGAQVLSKPLNYIAMIKPIYNNDES
ncbi:MAG: HNH endonuclease [Candidatus Humimicrobiaceae bacterium]